MKVERVMWPTSTVRLLRVSHRGTFTKQFIIKLEILLFISPAVNDSELSISTYKKPALVNCLPYLHPLKTQKSTASTTTKLKHNTNINNRYRNVLHPDREILLRPLLPAGSGTEMPGCHAAAVSPSLPSTSDTVVWLPGVYQEWVLLSWRCKGGVDMERLPPRLYSWEKEGEYICPTRLFVW